MPICEKDEMCTTRDVNIGKVASAQKADDAVGVAERHWFVAIVNNKSERQCATRLQTLGYECYVPVQEETHLWRNGVRKQVQRIVVPATVFVHVTERQRMQEIVRLPYVKRFMPNRASATDAYGRHSVAVIPDVQMQRLMYILGNADAPVEFDQMAFRLGDKVRVLRGGLMGMEGNIIECAEGGSAYFAISVDMLGVAKVRVMKDDLERIKD